MIYPEGGNEQQVRTIALTSTSRCQPKTTMDSTVSGGESIELSHISSSTFGYVFFCPQSSSLVRYTVTILHHTEPLFFNLHLTLNIQENHSLIVKTTLCHLL